MPYLLPSVQATARPRDPPESASKASSAGQCALTSRSLLLVEEAAALPIHRCAKRRTSISCSGWGGMGTRTSQSSVGSSARRRAVI